ncbi:TPA: hypothetical protein RQN02_004028, partial [Aeromonas veronii]|nr:hypothetical protein [Aeromonas veronii]
LEVLSKYIYYLHAECIKKSRVQGKVYDALVEFGWHFLGEADVTESLTGETKRRYTALLKEFKACGSIYSMTNNDSSFYGEDNAIKEYAKNLSDSLVAFLDEVEIPLNIKIKDDVKKRKVVKAHFARGWLVEPAIKMLMTIDNDTSNQYLIDLVGFMCMAFGTAAFYVLSEAENELIDSRSWIKSPDEFFISNLKEEMFHGSKITNRAVRDIQKNLYIKLIVFYLERNWDVVSDLYGTASSPYQYTIKNLLIVLSDIFDDVFTLTVPRHNNAPEIPIGHSIETIDEEIVMRARLNKIIGKKGPLLPEPKSSNET